MKSKMKKKLSHFFSLLIVTILFVNCSGDNQVEEQPEEVVDDGKVLIESLIAEFAKVGVDGGIPSGLQVVKTLTQGDDIQTAIDEVAATGGGVVVLKSGQYPVYTTLNLKSNVVLRGENKDDVVINSLIRSYWSQGKKNTINFDAVSYAGLENLTINYKVEGFEPKDRETWLTGYWCGECFENDPDGQTDLYVRQVALTSSAKNCWVTDCKILNSGTDPILVAGEHNTLKGNYIDRCFNKGGSGNGYYDIRGKYNLIMSETIKRIRHLAIQQGASYNVISDCYIEGDVNFHNGDKGRNLVEKTEIYLPTWHGWDIFGTGAAEYGHKPPGDDNILVNNITNYKNEGPRYANPNTIYSFKGFGKPVITKYTLPESGKFY
ncbi:hypothetical protein GCM10023163_14270 [Aestuariibaculum suncheonense]